MAAVILSQGAYQRYPLARVADRAQAPSWTRPCLLPPAPAVQATACAHVHGRVAWIQRHDPDGDGDRHLAVVSRFHVRVVKIQRKLGAVRLPAIGTRVDAVGYLVQGGSGRDEIDARRLVPGGPAGR